MVQIIAGNKGSGKTKKLIDMTNETANTSDHSVVFLDKDNSYMYEINRNVRFVNVNDYHIQSAEMFQGFLAGMLASNYDIGTIFIDAFLKLIKKDIAESADFIKSLEELGKEHEVTFVLSVSADVEQLPEFARAYVI